MIIVNDRISHVIFYQIVLQYYVFTKYNNCTWFYTQFQTGEDIWYTGPPKTPAQNQLKPTRTGRVQYFVYNNLVWPKSHTNPETCWPVCWVISNVYEIICYLRTDIMSTSKADAVCALNLGFEDLYIRSKVSFEIIRKSLSDLDRSELFYKETYNIYT